MNDAGRIGFVIKGDYSSSTTYEFLDVVYYRNATYIARKTTTGVLPTVTTDWFCAMNANIEGLVHVAVVNPNGTKYGANWLMKDGVVLTPQAEDIYRVLVGGKERMFFWNGTQYETLSGGGHTVQNTSGTALEQRDNLQFKDMSVSDNSTNNKTVIRQTQVVATKAEWDAMTPDPNVTYYLPWMSNTEYAEDRTPIGTVISVTTAKTGEVSGITTPTGEFPSSDYLVCDGAVKQIADYPKLADWFLERYGSKNYFGGNGTTTFAVPNFTADFPTNGILSIKAQMTSTQITYAEVNDSLTTENNVWSAEKINNTKADASSLSTLDAAMAYLKNKRLLDDTPCNRTDADHPLNLDADHIYAGIEMYWIFPGASYITGTKPYSAGSGFLIWFSIGHSFQVQIYFDYNESTRPPKYRVTANNRWYDWHTF